MDPIETDDVFDELLDIADVQLGDIQKAMEYHKTQYMNFLAQRQRWMAYVEQLKRTKHLYPDPPEECPTQKLN